MVIKLDERKYRNSSRGPPVLANIFMTRMLTQDLFVVVANLLVDTRWHEVVDICLKIFDCIGRRNSKFMKSSVG